MAEAWGGEAWSALDRLEVRVQGEVVSAEMAGSPEEMLKGGWGDHESDPCAPWVWRLDRNSS
jgi:hypothetical protein